MWLWMSIGLLVGVSSTFLMGYVYGNNNSGDWVSSLLLFGWALFIIGAISVIITNVLLVLNGYPVF